MGEAQRAEAWGPKGQKTSSSGGPCTPYPPVGSGEYCKHPSGSGQSLADKHFYGNFKVRKQITGEGVVIPFNKFVGNIYFEYDSSCYFDHLLNNGSKNV